ncbi:MULTISPECIES: hypothetical protein [unclassified Mesorhizobium]|nr:hypothetical protein [Mesorhizobium sp. LSJC280B00]
MHDAKGANKDAEADAAPEPEKRDHDAEIENRFGKKQETVQHGPISLPEIAAASDFPSNIV